MAIFKGITRRKGREEWWSIKVDSTLETAFLEDFWDDPRPDANSAKLVGSFSDLNLVKERLCPYGRRRPRRCAAVSFRINKGVETTRPE